MPEEVGNVEEAAEEQAEETDELAQVTRERDEYLDSLQRLKAEFDNFRKRSARDHENLVARASERLVRELLPVLDDLERALVAANEPARIADGQSPSASTQKQGEAKLEEGVRLVHRALADLLKREGLVEIETNGHFDPHVHEALLAQPAENTESGAVVDVLQKGYKLGEHVLRPARVVVAE